jgi:predicted TIM-barrel fold metal-dependent hydrolase
VYQIKAFPYDGAIDADGHVLEPAWLWEHYLEERYQERALRIGVDDNGLERLELDGRPSERTTRGFLGLLGAMGEADPRPGPDRRYMDNIPYGAGDANERMALLEKENLDAALLYPTIGLLWECEVTDAELSLAYTRAYNRWIADFCRASGGRLVAIAHLSLLDPEGAAAELRRAVADGCSGGFVAPFTHTRLAHGHPDHDVLWRTAVELDVPMAIHPTFEPVWCTPIRFDGFGRASEFHYNVMVRQGTQQSLLSFFTHGTIDRFPTLKLGVLESGMGWIGSFLDRADAVYETISLRGLTLSSPPSELFARQCFISGDPDETAAPFIMDHVGAHCFMWATDYPHPDHPGTWVDALTRLVEPLAAGTRRAFLGDNVRRLYGLTT